MNNKLAFQVEERGFKISAFYTDGPDAKIEITRDGKPYQEFLYPAYKIWNLAAHFQDIVDSELAKNTVGYEIAGSSGFGGMVMPKKIPDAPEETKK